MVIYSSNNEGPLISIIMNAFNGAKYLREAVDSVLKQSYTNWELVFWDNQSVDMTSEIFLSYSDNRLHYYYASSHTSLYEARNYAVQKSKGEFLAFLDVDDWWLPTKLEQQLPLFSDQEVGLVYSNFFWKDEINGKEFIAHKQELPSGYVLEKILQNYVVGLLTIIIRRSAFEQLQLGFNPAFNILGDYDLAIRIALDWKFAAVQLPVAFCRWHGSNLQITAKKQHINEMEHWVKFISNYKKVTQTKEYKILTQNVKRMRVVYEAINRNYLYVLKNFFLVSGLINKIKILIAIILPSKVFKIIVSKFS